MPANEGQGSVEDVRRSAEDIIREMLRTGAIERALALECLYYAREPDLLALLREVAALDEAGRARIAALLAELKRSQGGPPARPDGAR